MTGRISYFRQKGDAYVIATSIGLVLSLAMVFLIVFIILTKGLSFFWPKNIELVRLSDGKSYMGELWEQQDKIQADENGKNIKVPEIQLKIGNRDLYGLDFIWLDEKDIVERKLPAAAVTFEREEYGNFYGMIDSLHILDLGMVLSGKSPLEKTREALRLATANRDEIKKLEVELNRLTGPLTRLQREISLLEISPEAKTSSGKRKLEKLLQREAETEAKLSTEFTRLRGKIKRLYN
ncbi:MAG: hypothetical protein ACE5GL_04940 [Calditrichia bacterium]